MVVFQEHLRLITHGREFSEITKDVLEQVTIAGVGAGTCNVFIAHTSASLLVCENADPAVRRDLASYFARLVPDGDPRYEHDIEGPDDMPAHIRSVLTQTSITLPVVAGRLVLGTWQGIYLWEHRTSGQVRNVIITVTGE